MVLSQILFLLVAVFFAAMGVLYLVRPLAPYHEKMIGMSAREFDAAVPSPAKKLTFTLVKVVGLGFVALGVAIGYIGWHAATDSIALGILAFLLFVYGLPLLRQVRRAGGPILLVALGLLVYAGGLILALLA